MKHNIVSFAISLVVTHQSVAMHNESYYDLEQASHTNQKYDYKEMTNIIRLKNAIRNKDIAEIKKMEIKPSWTKELCHDALIEVKRTPSPMQRIVQGTGALLGGLLFTTAGSFNFLSSYVSGEIDSTCKRDCSRIGIEKPLCQKTCEIVSQPDLHKYEPPLGSLTIIAGLATSFYGSTFFWSKCRDLKKANEILEYINKKSDELDQQGN